MDEWSEWCAICSCSRCLFSKDLDDATYKTPDIFPETGIGALPDVPGHRDAVISTLVFVHESVGDANKRLLKMQGRQNYVTPRHYLDFINHFVKLINEKRDELEEQQLHLNIGLQKLRETEQQVKDMQISLAEKNRELETKNKQAEEKLKQMVQDQQVAEQKKKEAQDLQVKLDKQNLEIGARSEKAMNSLANVEPMVAEAKKAVTSIKKKDLEEVRMYKQPPQLVVQTMEAVTLLLTGKKQDWASISMKSHWVFKEISVLLKNWQANFRFEHESKICLPIFQ